MKPSHEPIGTRQLRWHDASGERDVLVRLWQPVAFEGTFVCDFAIDGLPEPVRAHGTGLDSLQALTIALVGIRQTIAPHRENISWLGVDGEHGVPLVVNLFFDAKDQRILEARIESEIERSVEDFLQPSKRWEASLREKYDPSAADLDLTACPTDELVAQLRAASERMRAFHARGKADAEFVFSQKRWPIVRALRERPEYEAVLRELTGDDDPALRFLAAQLLYPSATTLQRLRDDGVEPQAAEAGRLLRNIGDVDPRPKPWDEPDAPVA